MKEKDSKTILFTPVVKDDSTFCYKEQKQKSGSVVQKYDKDKQGPSSKNPRTGVANGRRSKEGKRVVPTAQSNGLAQELAAGTYECMVCCDRIKARHEIWGCPCCYNLFHLRCIGRWARSPAAAVNEGVVLSCSFLFVNNMVENVFLLHALGQLRHACKFLLFLSDLCVHVFIYRYSVYNYIAF